MEFVDIVNQRRLLDTLKRLRMISRFDHAFFSRVDFLMDEYCNDLFVGTMNRIAPDDTCFDMKTVYQAHDISGANHAHIVVGFFNIPKN